MTAYLDDYVEPSPFFGEHLLQYLSCMKVELVTGCTFKLTEKTTLPQVVIKGFNLCERKTPTSLAQRG